MKNCDMAPGSAVGDLANLDMEAGPPSQIFKKPVTDSSTRGFQVLKVKPVNSINTRSATIDFEVSSSSPTAYLDLSSLRLQGQFVVSAENGDAVAADAIVAPCNFTSQALFKSCEVYLDGKLTNSVSSVPFALKSYIEWIAGFDENCLKTHARPSLWTGDKTGHFDDLTAAGNPAFGQRMASVKENTAIHFRTKINHDLCSLTRYLPSNVRVGLRLTRASDRFVLSQPATNTTNYEIHLSNLEISVKQIELDPNIVLNHQALMAKGLPARFPYLSCECKSYNLPANSRDISISNCYFPQLPSFIILGFQTSARFAGSKQLNCLRFAPPPLQSCEVNVNGARIHEFKLAGGVTDLTKDALSPCLYEDVMTAFGFAYSSASNSIDFETFCKDVFLLPVDLSPSQTGNTQVHQASSLKTGALDITLSFWEALSESYQLIIYSTLPREVLVKTSGVELRDLI